MMGSSYCSAFLLRGSQLSRGNSSAHAKLFLIGVLPGSAIGLRMVAAANLVEVAALVGDTARATMLNALMGGQLLTATELAYCANVSRSTASGHLSKLVAARLLTVTRERRFSYYRIASPLIATMLESIKVVAAIEVPPRRHLRSANDDALRFARSCYDHLAGKSRANGTRTTYIAVILPSSMSSVVVCSSPSASSVTKPGNPLMKPMRTSFD